MTDPVWPQHFPGGVADAASRYALLRDQQGRLLAVRLDDGHVLWCSEASLLPLLLGAKHAVGLAVSPPHVVALALEGTQAGKVACTSAPLPWPAWALTADPGLVDLDVEAAWLGNDVGLHWHLRQRRTGGAPPGPNQSVREVADGQCSMDIESGSVQALASWPTRPTGFAQAEEVADPQVLAQAQLGAQRYRLVAKESAAGLRTSLVAQDATHGRLLWEQVLGDAPRRPAAALRPQVGGRAR